MKEFYTKVKEKVKKFLRWILDQCKDRKTLALLCVVIFFMYTPVWGGYLVHALFGWGWGSAIATTYMLFWAGPFTPFFPLCIAITFGIKRLIQLITGKKDKDKKDEAGKNLPEVHNNEEGDQVG